MHLDGQCELLEQADGRLYADRASLYTAWLWQRLWRAIQRRDNRPVHAVFQNERLLTLGDRLAIEDRETWRGDGLRNLPCAGLLLPTLFRQADEQWRQEARAGTEARARCAVEVPEARVAEWLSADDRAAWLQAVRDLGLVRPAKGRFVWSHPSWGEFLASRNLLASPDPAGLDPGKLNALLAALAPPPLARRDADELAHLRQQVVQAWGAVPQAFWDRLLDEGLVTDEWRLRGELRSSGLPDQASDNLLSGFGSAAVFRFADGQVQVDIRRWGDLLGEAGYFGPSVVPWHRRPEAWQALVVNRFWDWMRKSVFERLDASMSSTLRANQGRLQLPGAGDLDETLTLAVQGLEDPMAWLHTLALRGPLRAAAQATKAVMHRLEGPRSEPALARRAVPLLRHLRRMLLLRSLDAGAQVKARVLAAGIGQSVALAPELDVDAVLNSAWLATWASAFKGDGVDVRERLEAGLLLGQLGDDLRYRWCERQVGSEPRPRRGLVLRHQHWIDVGRKGVRTGFELGDAHGPPDESPWVAQLDHFQIGACLVTNAEFKAFVDGSGYADANAPWWRQAGQAAQTWLREAQSRGATPSPWSLGASGFDNPLQPALMTAHEARAYAHWAAPLYGPPEFDDGLAVALPVEAQWEAGVRGEPPGCGRWPHMPPGAAAGGEPDGLCFNHVATRWGRTSPVGVFSRGWTNAGVADAAGSSWEWTDSVYEADAGRAAPPAAALKRASADDGTSPRAARGGGYFSSAVDARAGFRLHSHPGYEYGFTGVRLVRVRLPH
jgi:formylglycine-generating enzyme required for sulfatase activity